VAVIALALALTAASPAASRSNPRARARQVASTPLPKLFGFNDGAIRAGLISAAADADLTAKAGANVHRVVFDWRRVEARRGNPDFTAYDRIYRAMLARGVRPLLILMLAPSWALDGACDQYRKDCRYPPSPAHDDAWRNIAAKLAQRYPWAAGIEIWNEPNLRATWRPRPDPARYAQLLREAYQAIKAVNPRMPVAGGALNDITVNTSGGDISLRNFAAALYANGGRGYMDALSFHDYPWSTDIGPGTHFAKTLAAIRAVRDAAGDAATPLWVTETGVSTTGTDLRFVFSQEQQAATLVAILDALGREADVKMAIVHTLLEGTQPASSPELGYGLVHRDLTPKLAFCAIAAARGSAWRC
jgi:hypothetical protein